MQHFIRRSLAVALAAAFLTTALRAEDNPAGYVDFGKFDQPASGGQFVEVNVNSNLIALASRLAKSEEPDITDLLSSLKRIHVNVIGLDDGNREDLKKRLQSIRTSLDGTGWDRVVTVQEKGSDVDVRIKTSS